MIKNRKSFIIGIKSLKLSNNEKIFLTTHKPWGVILFSRNIKSIKQTKHSIHCIYWISVQNS